jgi:hypothetical protein
MPSPLKKVATKTKTFQHQNEIIGVTGGNFFICMLCPSTLFLDEIGVTPALIGDKASIAQPGT